MKHVWIGGVAPIDRFESLMKIGDKQFAANNTQLLYINGIEKNINNRMTIISSHFIPNYSKNKILFFKRKTYDNWIDIGFINLPVFKQISKSLNVAKEVKKVIKEHHNENFVFYIYSMTTPLMYSARIINKLRKKYNLNIKIIQIVPDLPQYMNFERKNVFWKIAKSLDIKIINGLLKYIDKYVLFSKHMADKLKIDNDKFITIEGMIDVNDFIDEKAKEKKDKEKVVMYAGGINEEYGVYDLIDAFTKANIPKYELHLYGPCADVKKLESTISNNKNIKYYGSLPRKKILELESKAILLVNPRKSTEDYTKYSFPSKTMEYLLSGTPVLMYKLESMPNEYNDYIYFIDSTNYNNFKEALIKICTMNLDELIEKGKKAQEFVANSKNNVIQCKKIIDFIKQ